LIEVAEALSLLGGHACSREAGQDESHEQSDNADDDQQFQNGKTEMTRSVALQGDPSILVLIRLQSAELATQSLLPQ